MELSRKQPFPILAPASLLFVCSGNICRSPAAEAMARRWLDLHGLGDVRTASCGTLKLVGEPAALFTQRALAERGVDLSSHRSRGISHFLLREADLVIGMEALHRDAAMDELGGDTDLVAHGFHVVTEWHPDERLRNDAGIFDFVREPWDSYLEGIEELERCVIGMLHTLYPNAASPA